MHLSSDSVFEFVINIETNVFGVGAATSSLCWSPDETPETNPDPMIDSIPPIPSPLWPIE